MIYKGIDIPEVLVLNKGQLESLVGLQNVPQYRIGFVSSDVQNTLREIRVHINGFPTRDRVRPTPIIILTQHNHLGGIIMHEPNDGMNGLEGIARVVG